MITNSLRYFDVLTNEVLLRKVGDGSKRPRAGQGSYSQDRVSPSMDTAFSTMMLGATTGGDPYNFSKYDRMFPQCRVFAERAARASPTPQRVIVSYK